MIVLGVSVGGGEFLLGPAVFVRHGLTLLWVTTVAVFFQTIFNTELMRYTVATGEPVLTGFMRTAPRPAVWAWFYSILFFLPVGWPASAGVATGAIFYLGTSRLAGAADAGIVYLIGVGTFLACVSILLVGRRIERTLEILNWVMVVCTLGGFTLLAFFFVPASTWAQAAAGLAGFDLEAGRFVFLPAQVDFFLLAAFVAYSGCGGMLNITLSNWARDKGYGMGQRAGYIPSAVGGHKVPLAPTGFIFDPGVEADRRWRGWWRIVRADQWGVFFTGALLGMMVPALLYVTLLESGTNIQGLGISAALAQAMAVRGGAALGLLVAVLGAWLLFKTQLDLTEALVRTIADVLWTGSARVRAWRGGDVRAVYYAVLLIAASWGIVALRLAQPIILLQIAANVAAIVFVVASLHLLYLNTVLLPAHVRPPFWRRAVLVAMSAFYGFFVLQSVRALV
ncbi:MAG: Nramp family divalent metal transporter [Acidobacteria bacterium]|nr:Nramp family divalent metal transporter [Acidobacteriota bacterium]